MTWPASESFVPCPINHWAVYCRLMDCAKSSTLEFFEICTALNLRCSKSPVRVSACDMAKYVEITYHSGLLGMEVLVADGRVHLSS